MIIDALDQADLYTKLHPGFATAVRFLRQPDLANLPDGRYAIDGDSVYAMVSRQPARDRAGAKLEIHRRYLDLHYLIAGCEEMGWKPTPVCTAPEADFDEDRDCQLFEDAPDTWVAIHPGQFAIVYPQDAHLPLVGKGDLHKVVIKILC